MQIFKKDLISLASLDSFPMRGEAIPYSAPSSAIGRAGTTVEMACL